MRWDRKLEFMLFGFLPKAKWQEGREPEGPGLQKFGSMLCCEHRSRASSVVTKGFLLIWTRRDAPKLSL